jgi:hypothetical protein
MKIAFMVATRGNPHRAAAVIECAKNLASGQHEIEYIAGIDADDAETYKFFCLNYQDIKRSVAVRPKGLGSVWNRMVDAIPDADVYCPFADDVFIGMPDWDAYIVNVLSTCYPKPELGVLAWNDLANPNQCTLPIVTRQWIEVSGKLYDDRFPFWFYDSAVSETWSFVTGGTVPIIPKLVLAAKKGTTKRLRDLRFWWGVYIKLREERLAKGAGIREKLGLTLPDDRLKLMIEAWENRDQLGMAEIEKMEELWPDDKNEPTGEYIAAKAEAELLVAA